MNIMMKRKIISIVVALVMVLTMMPITAMGSTMVNNVDDLKSAFTTGGMVTLGANIEGVSKQLVIGEGISVILNLNNKTISASINKESGVDNSGYVIRVERGGNLNIYGDGHIYNTNTSEQGYGVIVNYGKLTINGGKYGKSGMTEDDCTRGNALRNHGTAVINNGEFTCCDNYVDGGFAYPIANSAGKTVINNAIVKGNCNGLVAADGGVVTIKGGTYNLGDGKSSNNFYIFYIGNGVINVEKGNFTRNVKNEYGFMYDSSGKDNTGQINIKGGDFVDKINNAIWIRGDVFVSGGDINGGIKIKDGSTNVSISGGYIGGDIDNTIGGVVNVTGGGFCYRK